MSKEKRPGKQTAIVAEKTKRSIMDAAAKLFAANGFSGTSLREIAAAADLSHGIIRHHFGSKLEIWQAIAESAFERYTRELMPIIVNASQSDAPYDAFVGVVRSFIRLSVKQPALISLIVKEGGEESERSDLIKQRFSILHDQIAILFERAQKETKALAHHTNDSFFLFLISLVAFPIVLPLAADSMPLADTKSEKQNQMREHMILKTLLDIDE